MPFVQTRLTVKLNDSQCENLHTKIEEIIKDELSKPVGYIMVGIEDGYRLYMGGKHLDRGAMISVQYYGGASESALNSITARLCSLLEELFGISPSCVYVTYQSINDWGFNGRNF